MRTSIGTILGVLASVAGVAVPALTVAQPEGSWQPPMGQMPPQQQPPMGQMPPQQQPPMGQMPGAPYPPDPSLAPPMDGGQVPPQSALGASDHAGVVGSFGVGFFGVLTVPVMGCDAAACTMPADDSTVSAPTIGIRYWLDELLGIEAALGLNVTSGESGGFTASSFAAALHGGVPLALAHSGHFVFEVVPQLNFGISSGSYEVIGTTSDVSGMLIEVGGKAGGEIHFGFIDVPQLSVQGSVGLMVRHESRSVDTVSGVTPAISFEQSETFVGTGVDGEPWDIFTGSIAAVYYF